MCGVMLGEVLDRVEGAQFVAHLHVQFVTREGGALPSRGGTVPITSAHEGVINVRFWGCQKGPLNGAMTSDQVMVTYLVTNDDKAGRERPALSIPLSRKASS